MVQVKSLQTGKACPFWDCHANNECTMFKGGIFLPMEEHVSRYCRTSRHRFCKQYMLSDLAVAQAGRKYNLSSDESRRLHHRLHKKFSVRLYSCDSHGDPVTLLSDKVETMDLSAGGLGMLSSTKLEAGQQVAIHFDAGFKIPGLSGKGTICWCESADDDHYQAGVAFSGSRIGQVVAGLWPGES